MDILMSCGFLQLQQLIWPLPLQDLGKESVSVSAGAINTGWLESRGTTSQARITIWHVSKRMAHAVVPLSRSCAAGILLKLWKLRACRLEAQPVKAWSEYEQMAFRVEMPLKTVCILWQEILRRSRL